MCVTKQTCLIIATKITEQNVSFMSHRHKTMKLLVLFSFLFFFFFFFFESHLYCTLKILKLANKREREREREMFYLTTHSTRFIYGYIASDIWLRTILIVRMETRCRHIGYSYRLTARVLLYAPSHRHDNTYHSLCYTSRGELAGTRNSSMGPPHEGSIRRPIAP